MCRSHSKYSFCAVLILLVIGEHRGCCESPGKETPPSADNLERVIGATSALERQIAIKALFRNATSDQLQQLTTHPDSGIALTAAWHRVLRSVPGVGLDHSVEFPSVRLSSAELDWFVGFVEGRSRIVLPPWWKRDLRETYALAFPSLHNP